MMSSTLVYYSFKDTITVTENKLSVMFSWFDLITRE